MGRDLTDKETLESCARLTALDQANRAELALEAANANITHGVKNMFGSIDFNDEDLQKLTNTLNDWHGCNTECQQDKLRNNLKELWKEADKDEELAKVKVIKAARDYYLMDSTENDTSFNNSFIAPSISADWYELINPITAKIDDLSNSYNIMYQTYITDGSMQIEINNMIDLKDNKLNEIMKNINEYEKLVNVDIRKSFYQFKEFQFYKDIKYYIQLIYYVLFIIYILFGDFISEKRYKDKKFYGIAIIYLLFPLALKYILGFIMYIYNYILKYFNLKDPIYSYSDIVRANNIEKIYTSPVPDANDKNNNYLYNKYVAN